MCLFDEGDSSMNQPIRRKIWFEWINLVPVAWFAMLQIHFGVLILQTMLYIQWISLDIADKRDAYIIDITNNCNFQQDNIPEPKKIIEDRTAQGH